MDYIYKHLSLFKHRVSKLLNLIWCHLLSKYAYFQYLLIQGIRAYSLVLIIYSVLVMFIGIFPHYALAALEFTEFYKHDGL